MVKVTKRFTTAMMALEVAGRKLPLRERLIVQLRASMVNGCEYCINMHSDEARKKGESDLIDILREAECGSELTPREGLLVDYVDMGTKLSNGVDAQLHDAVVHEFGEETVAFIIQAIVSINAWNRIGVLSQK